MAFGVEKSNMNLEESLNPAESFSKRLTVRDSYCKGFQFIGTQLQLQYTLLTFEMDSASCLAAIILFFISNDVCQGKLYRPNLFFLPWHSERWCKFTPVLEYLSMFVIIITEIHDHFGECFYELSKYQFYWFVFPRSQWQNHFVVSLTFWIYPIPCISLLSCQLWWWPVRDLVVWEQMPLCLPPTLLLLVYSVPCHGCYWQTSQLVRDQILGWPIQLFQIFKFWI